MRRIAGLVLICTGLTLGYATPAEAQFWKKIFRKEQPKRKPVAKKPVVKNTAPAQPVKKRKEVNYPPTVKKNRYRVDVLVPLYLNELVVDGKVAFKNKMPAKAEGGMDFYEGIKLAADTLNSFFYDVDVYVHDITDPAETPERLIDKGKLDSTDLIIGAVQSQQIPKLAAFAQKHQINFVSALSPSDGDVKDNPYFILMQPTLRSHCAYIMERVKKKHKTQPVLFYRTSLGVAEEAYNYLITDASKDIEKVLCNSTPTKAQLKPLFDSTKTNVVIMGLMDHSNGEEILQSLATWFPNYRFDVYGMPTWRSMNSLRKADAYPNIAVYITAPFYFDPSGGHAQLLSGEYKKDFGNSKPGELTYRGYETMFWYTQLLKKYGTIFNEKFSDNATVPFTRYEIKPQWDKNDFLYNENTKVYLFRYQGGSFMIEP
jgi:hypothetical protein